MHKSIRVIGWSVLIVSTYLLATVAAQMDDDFDAPAPGDALDGMGPVGNVGDDTAGPQVFIGDEDLLTSYPGPLGRVDERLAHEECDACFTVPGLDSARYQIFEQLELNGEEFLVPRLVPNPAPLGVDDEVRERYDAETGEDIWYVGDQAFIGPTDDEPWTDTLSQSRIELTRLQMAHQDNIFEVQGVHRFGLGLEGFSVSLDPQYAANESALPKTIGGVPVVVEIEPILQATVGHARYRPVPVGASLAVEVRPGVFYVGTLGPHVVRTVANVGTCCQLWSLMSGHVVRADPDLDPPTPGTVQVYQPWSGRAVAADVIGTVAHTFQMEPCADTRAEAFTDCGEGAPLNRTTSEPDVAALDYTPSGDFQTYPYDRPSGTAPTRHMHYRSNRYVNGPSGRIMTAYAGHKHKMWGAYTPAANRGRVRAVGQTAVVEMGISHKFYRVCCLNSLDLPSKLGDSGALVAYSGMGSRHIAGMQMAKSSTTGYAWYIPANDIKMAFSNAHKSFNHFWGTKSGYWKPSGRSTDLQ